MDTHKQIMCKLQRLRISTLMLKLKHNHRPDQIHEPPTFRTQMCIG